ncbi:MAG: sugar isomerase domain-containing protein [Limnochordaceae bacterium]|nr:sugar isomerase domain-containing protein [Limnochordaceae bacterium]
MVETSTAAGSSAPAGSERTASNPPTRVPDAIAAYFADLNERLSRLAAATAPALHRLAVDIAAAIADGGHQLHLLDHGHLLGQELTWRAGGLPLVHVLDKEAALSPVIVRRGDWVIVASVSGRGVDVVETALGLKRRGVRVIALTSLEQSRTVQPAHASGQLLYQVADYVIDLPIPAGDAVLALPGLEEKVAPASGVLSVAAMWALLSQIAAELVAHGLHPTVFRSVNLPGGEEEFNQAVARYRATGL